MAAISMTVHKAKGREWEKVVIRLEPNSATSRDIYYAVNDVSESTASGGKAEERVYANVSLFILAGKRGWVLYLKKTGRCRHIKAPS